MPNPGGSSRESAVASTPSGGGAPDAALRLALSLPGGVAPGTFEAGTVCGLLAWMQEVNALEADAVLVDVITGASAGALTGLLAARVLLAGDDPVAVYRQAWVTAPQLRAMRPVGSWAPLSLRPARTLAHRLLFAPSEPGGRWQQTSPVTLDVALACLRGFIQEIAAGDDVGDGPRIAASYVDWSSFDLNDLPTASEADAREWTKAIESVIASASHPLAFPARRLDRESFRADYLRSGVVNLPADEDGLRLCYTDGGLVENEPLGRCIVRVGERDGAQTQGRLVLLVRASVRWPPPADNPAWSGDRRPRWTETLARVLDLVATHAAGQDVLRVEQVNARLRWTNEVAAKIADVVHADERTRAELESLLERLDEERLPFARLGHRPVRRLDPSGLTLPELIAEVLRAAAGLTAKRPIKVAVVSPDAAYTGPQALRSIVGFLERRQRAHHFAAGYWSMLRWLERAPTLNQQLRPDLIAAAVSAAENRVPEPSARQQARDASRRLPLRTRLELGRVAARAGWIARADVDAFFDVREEETRRARRRVR